MHQENISIIMHDDVQSGEKAINRIFKYIAHKGLNAHFFEKKSGLSVGYLANHSKRGSGLGENIILKVIDNFPDLSLEWLLTGEGPMLREGYVEPVVYGKLEDRGKTTLNIEQEQLVPLYDVEARAGTDRLFVNDNGGMLIDPVGHIRVPGLPKCSGAVYVSGDSMYPTLQADDIVLYQVVNDKDNFVWGGIYLLDIEVHGDTMVVIKQVNKGADAQCIRLVSHNTLYRDMEVRLDHVRSLAFVKMYLRKGFFA